MDTPLKRLRLSRGLTQTEVAKAVGIDQSALSLIESGVKTSAGTAEKLAEYYDRKISEEQILYPERFPA